MLINTDFLRKLNPCQNRLDNFTINYLNFNGNIIYFLSLDKITYEDKVWVAKRLLTKAQAIEWTCLCAESVIHKYEKEYPNDSRPRMAIEAARTNGENINNIANAASYAASYAAYAANVVAYAAQKDKNIEFLKIAFTF